MSKRTPKPVASEARTMPVRFDRFRGLAPWEVIEGAEVNVIGCGGIGSWTAMALACLGVKLRVFDPDRTEEHNFGGQPLGKVGKSKVQQVAGMTKGLGRMEVHEEMFSLERGAEADIWVSGVDSVESRLAIWEMLLANVEKSGRPTWYVDGRMGGTTSQVFSIDTVDAGSRKRYEASLAPKNGFDDDPCALRSTVFAGMGCASGIVAEVARRLAGKATSRVLNVEWLSGDTIVLENF